MEKPESTGAVTQPASVMDRLRDETREQHRRAESRPLEQALVKGTVPRPAYVEYLWQRLHMHVRLETLMRSLCTNDPRFGGFMHAELFQEANLQRDLEALAPGAATGSVRPATARLIKGFDRAWAKLPVSLLGAYYVFEGSKNGARYIARAVGPTLGLAPGPGLLYLDPHGPAQRARWQAFRAGVDAQDWSATEANAIVGVARATFDGLSAADDELWAAFGGG